MQTGFVHESANRRAGKLSVRADLSSDYCSLIRCLLRWKRKK